jgi:hypothetical protein
MVRGLLVWSWRPCWYRYRYQKTSQVSTGGSEDAFVGGLDKREAGGQCGDE